MARSQYYLRRKTLKLNFNKNIRGKTINIFIPDSNPRGLKICDIADSIVKAIFIPRNRLKDVYKRTDLLDPGVYFLFGSEDEINKPKVYIGEAENLLTRIKQHNANYDFWNTAICFVSEKKNINKAHIKYLESYCISEAQRINRYNIKNSVNPAKPSLTEQEIDFALSFFDDLKILIAALGFPIFEESKKKNKNRFFCKSQGIKAEGEYLEDGMTVFKGSQARLKSVPSVGKSISNLREILIDKKILVQDSNAYTFQEDYTFKSPSSAATVILASNANGWDVWKNSAGKSLDSVFRKNND